MPACSSQRLRRRVRERDAEADAEEQRRGPTHAAEAANVHVERLREQRLLRRRAPREPQQHAEEERAHSAAGTGGVDSPNL